MHPNQERHLEFIQGIIARMNSNSFQIKGWTITIFSALLALFASTNAHNYVYLFIAAAPTILFGSWMLHICSENGNSDGYMMMWRN